MSDQDPAGRLFAAMVFRHVTIHGTPPPTPYHTADRLASQLRISPASVAADVERLHHWAPGSVEAVLAGGDPTPLPGVPEPEPAVKRRRGVSPPFRVVESHTDASIDHAVLLARSVVALDERAAALDERAAALENEANLLEAKLAEQQEWSRRGEKERRKLNDRLFAVSLLHAEAEQVSCGEGCCHEGLGYCRYCREPYPCRTVLVSKGKPDPGFREPVAEAMDGEH